MPQMKKKIIIGILTIVLISTWTAVSLDPLNGIAVFFVLMVLLWAIVKIKGWV